MKVVKGLTSFVIHLKCLKLVLKRKIKIFSTITYQEKIDLRTSSILSIKQKPSWLVVTFSLVLRTAFLFWTLLLKHSAEVAL